MKSINLAKYSVLGVLLTCTLALQARVFEKGERLYFNGKPSDASWWMDHTGNTSDPDYTRLWAYFYNGGSHKWIEAHLYGSTNFYVEETATNDWSHVILTRHRGWVNEPAFDANCLNQTGDINLNVSTGNYMQNFYYGGSHEEANWWVVAPSPSGNPAGWTLPYEDEQICTSAAGTLYILAPKNYNYDNSKNHAWFEYSGGSWTRLDGDEFRSSEGLQDFNVTLGAAYSDTYYFLQAGKPSACRLIRVRLNRDCSDGAEGACKITSFVGVASEANVTDQTCAINGVVAFDDKKNAGDLMIWCDGVDTVVIPNASIEIPHTFKLKGFGAASITSYTLNAKFLDGTSDCEASCVVTVQPPTAPVTTHTTTQTIGDLSLTRFTEEDITLTPTNQTSTYFQWTNSANDDKFTDVRIRTFTGPTEAQDIDYVYLATQDPPEPAGNLIENGDLEYNGDFASEYDYWGIDQTEYYGSHPGASGGYSITPNSQTFSSTYIKVTPHKGAYFGLFDSKATGNVEDQVAWIATTATNPKLKVEAGVSYLFSFWVANINNFGEMNNGARLQFQISYNGGTTWNNLGSTINLSDYRDNRWHGISSIATPTVTSNNVAIRVINLNASLQNRGNDFALDDIEFAAVTANTAHIAAFERFPVKYLKCEITGATFEQKQPVGCGTTVADVDYTITFAHPRGDLYIYEGTTLLAHIPHATVGDETTSYTGVIADQPLDNADHVLTVYFEDALVRTDAPTTYSYNAKAVPAISVKSLTWTPLPDCDVTTATLTAVISYTNQNGTLTANVDGGTAVSEIYTVESDDEKDVTLVIPGVVADGKTGHKLNVNFSGSHGCSIIDHDIPAAAPYMPSVTVSAPEIQPYACGDATYDVKVSATFTNGQLHDIIFKDWKTGTEVHEATTTNDGTAEHTFTYAWDAVPTAHEYNVYFVGANTCDHKKSYTSPAEPALTVTPSYIHSCDVTTYSLRLDIAYTNQRADNILANVDGGTNVTKANAHKSQMTEATDFIRIDGLVADGKEHKYNLWFDDAADCKALNVDFSAPYEPQITATSATVEPFACGDATYGVKVKAEFTNGQGHNLVFEDWNGHKQVIATDAADTEKEYTFAYAWEVPATHEYKIYFEGAEGCGISHKPSFTSPAEPKIDNIAYAITPATACDATTYDLTVTFDYINQDGTLSVEVDGTPASSITPAFVANSADKQSATATFTALPADGVARTITVKTVGGFHNCTATKALTDVPHLPVINSIAQAFTPAYSCGDEQYHVTLTVNYTNALGKDIKVKEGTTVIKSFTANAGIGTFADDIQLDFDFGTNHDLKVYFEDREDCAEDVTVTSPAEPALTVTPSYIHSCDVTTYSLRLDIAYTNQRADNILANVDGGTNVTKANAHKSQMTEATDFIRIDGLVADGKEHKYNLWFDDAADCKALNVDFSAPYEPQITATSATVEPFACGDATYGVKVKAEFTNGQGHNLVFEDWNGHKQVIATDAADTEKEYTFAYAWEVPATHEYKIYFEGAEGCGISHKPSFTSPLALTIDNITVSGVPTDILCDQTEYNATVTITLPFDAAIGKTVVVSHEGVNDNIVVTANPMVATVKMTTADAAGLTMTAHLGEAPTCFVTSNTFDAPARLSCVKDEASVCVGDSYTWPLTGLSYGPFIKAGIDTVVSALNIHDTLLVTVNALPEITLTPIETLYDDVTEIRIPYTVTQGTPNLFGITLGGVTTSQKRAATNELVIAKPSSLTIGDYTVTVVVKDTNTTCQSNAAPLLIHIIEKPLPPAMSILNVTPSVLADCEKSLSASFDVEYVDQTGTLTYWLDDNAADAQTAPFIANDNTSHTVTGLTLDNVPADGQEHTIHVQFADAEGCKGEAKFNAPLTHAIDNVAVSGIPAQLECNETSYIAMVTIQLPFEAPGQKLVLTHEGQDTALYVDANPMTALIPMHTTDATGLTVTVRFCDAPACPAVSNTFDAPTRLTCVKDYVDICLGDSYTWPNNGMTYSPTTVGLHKFANNTDTLFLTVREEPVIRIDPISRICEDAAEIRWPYVVVAGTPDVFTAHINGKDYDVAYDDAELILAMPADLQPGDYKATFTVGDAAVTCTSTAEANVTLAAGGYMYSKWEDVLFIDNSSGRFTAYQWYENGNAIPDETKQYLYKQRGLPGLYFCRMTTVDETVLYTCEKSFEEVTPSRTVDKTTQPASVKIFDPMGRIVSGTPTNGIYIILEEFDGIPMVRKIAVYE